MVWELDRSDRAHAKAYLSSEPGNGMTALAKQKAFWLNYYTWLHHPWVKHPFKKPTGMGWVKNELLVKKEGLWWRVRALNGHAHNTYKVR